MARRSRIPGLPTSGAHLRSELTTLGAGVVRLGPSPGPRWPLAVQAGLAMGVPVVTLSLLGRPDLGLLAASGAFTGLYGSRANPRERAVLVPVVAAALMLSVLAGVGAASAGVVGVMVGLLVWTVLASAGSLAFSLGPPGPIFLVLVYGLSAGVTVVRDGERAVSPVVLVAVVAGSSLLAYLVALAPLVLRRHRAAAARPLRELLPGPRLDADARVVLLRIVVVAVLGVALAAVVDPHRAYWVVTAGVAVVGVSSGRRVTVTRGVHRALGTLVGAGIYLAIAGLSLTGVLLGVVLGLLQLVIELVVVRNYALALVFITPLVLLIVGATGASTGSLEVATERVVDTLVGAAVGMLCAFVIGPLPARAAEG